jgi:hypothetical protein
MMVCNTFRISATAAYGYLAAGGGGLVGIRVIVPLIDWGRGLSLRAGLSE